MRTKSLVYVGQDESFFSGLKKTLDKVYGENVIKAHRFDLQSQVGEIPSFVPKVLEYSPQIIMVDFSLGDEKSYLLARHLRLSIPTETAILIGILDRPRDEDEIVKEGELVSQAQSDYIIAALTQAPIIHYKGDDYEKIIYHSLYLYEGDKAARGQFATYKQKKIEDKFFYFSSVTHILNDALIVESSLEWEKGDIILLRSDFIAAIDKKFFMVEKRSSERLSTKFNYRYRLASQFEYEKELPKVNLELLKNYLNSLDRSGSNKKLKLMMIQNGLQVLEQIETPLSQLPYLIRYQTRLKDHLKMIFNFLPNLLAIELEDVKEEIDGGTTLPNNIETVAKIVEMIKEHENYNPVISLHGSSYSTEKLREKLDYQFIISHRETMSLKFLLDMLGIYGRKKGDFDPYENDDLISSKDQPFSVYALHRKSRIKLSVPIEITSISEQDLTFTTEIVLPERGVLYKCSDVPFYLTISTPPEPLENIRGKNHYYALINGVTPSRVQELRKYINHLFFAEHEEKRKQEVDEFKKKNIEALQKKKAESKKS